MGFKISRIVIQSSWLVYLLCPLQNLICNWNASSSLNIFFGWEDWKKYQYRLHFSGGLQFCAYTAYIIYFGPIIVSPFVEEASETLWVVYRRDLVNTKWTHEWMLEHRPWAQNPTSHPLGWFCSVHMLSHLVASRGLTQAAGHFFACFSPCSTPQQKCTLFGVERL